MERADAYLAIPEAYADRIDGLRWSADRSAIEMADGSTFAVVEKVEQVLEGVFASGRVPHFIYVLQLLHWFKDGGPLGLWRLHDAFQRCTPGSNFYRNWGALIAELCRIVPPVADPPAWEELRRGLKMRRLNYVNYDPTGPSSRSEEPPLGPAAFATGIDRVLAHLEAAVLDHWLAHGCPPATAAAKRLAEAAVERPAQMPTLAEVVRQRPRLFGAVALVPVLNAVLALPPRKLARNRQDLGGFAGVTTRGTPELLLPSQFALEPLDFVRRFAENELLYFRREEPHRGQQSQRLIVLDQGVRTWGGVRLATAGAALALLTPRRGYGPLRLGTTGEPTPFDPAALNPEQLADLLEASDLSPDPGDALAQALNSQGDDRPRDVLLLTHPRNLREPAVTRAASLRQPTDRLFALTVDDAGQAELAEWRGGAAVRVRSFRVDLAAAVAATGPPTQAAGPHHPEWTGDIEPVPFPFRLGLVDDPSQLAFDAAGEHLLVRSKNGLLHLARLDGSPIEVLPRAFLSGRPLISVSEMFGLPCGFAVCGSILAPCAGSIFRFDSTQPPLQPVADEFAVAYYSLADRTVTLHTLGPSWGATAITWLAYPDLQSVLLEYTPHGVNQMARVAVDLITSGRFPGDPNNTLAITSRAQQAHSRLSEIVPPPPNGTLLRTPQGASMLRGPWVDVNRANGQISVVPPMRSFIPQSDGQPLLRNATISALAQLASTTLATDCSVAGKARILLLDMAGERVVGQYPVGSRRPVFQLSSDGRLLARRIGTREVQVVNVAAGGTMVVSLVGGGGHTELFVTSDDESLDFRIGSHLHHFSLSDVPFRYLHTTVAIPPAPRNKKRPHLHNVPKLVAYDRRRFHIAAEFRGRTAVNDRFGQVLLLNPSGQLVATFAIRRDLAAVWLPNSTRWGARALLGGPATPGADQAVGRALREVLGESS